MRNRVIAVFALAGTGAALAFATPAQADPGGIPGCGGPLSIVCNMLPAMPDLDHDIDMTVNQPPATVDQEHMAPTDVCFLGCI